MTHECKITNGSVTLYTVPTDAPEADGTFAWKSTSMVLIELQSGAVKALGYSYADAGTAAVADKLLRKQSSAAMRSGIRRHCRRCSAPFAIWERPGLR